jgi:hypothetical protein
MEAESLDREVTDFATAVLLRYFGSVAAANVHRPILAIERDREMLRLQWSLSNPVSELVNYALTHHHEIQTVLESHIRIEDGVVRGRLDAMKTVRLRRVSGLPTAVVSHEPVRSYASGPNHVLGWVLAQAWSLASRFARLTLDSRSYQGMIDSVLQRLERTRRLHAIAQITGPSANRRPTGNALIEASRSRQTIYRLATKAYRALLAIEAGDPDAIAAMLRETLLAPLEPWRRYELAVGFAAAEALAASEQEPLTLNLLLGDKRRQIARAGDFEIYWQTRTDHYVDPVPEPSEQVWREILQVYGMNLASDRPDLVIANRFRDRVEAIIEVKYLTGEDGSDRFRSAVAQLVRYARGYKPLEDCADLLGKSVVALSQGTETISTPNELAPGVPILADFAHIKRGQLALWAQRLSASNRS